MTRCASIDTGDMIQRFYRRHIMERFMTAEELSVFDSNYQAQKVPTANNLGQKTFDQLVEEKVKKVLSEQK